MKLKVLILLFVPFMLVACRDDDNPRSRPNLVETSFTDISGELTNDYGVEVLTDRNTHLRDICTAGQFSYIRLWII